MFFLMNTIFTCLLLITISKAQINTSYSYNSMPPLYIFDDYNNCLDDTIHENQTQVYCMTYAEIIPNNTSLRWQQIKEFSYSYQFHYRHDHLFRGVCLENNTILTNRNNTRQYENLAESDLINLFKSIYEIFKNEFLNLSYQREINDRLNEAFQKDYNLSLQTLTLYCDSKEFKLTKGWGFKITLLMCICLILLNILSSLYDGCLKSHKTENIKNDNQDNKSSTNRVCKLLTCFSIQRNLKCLLNPNKKRFGIDLDFLDGVRAILSLLIVCGHSFYLQFVPLENPVFFENLYHQYFMKLLLHGLVMVELFFVLSGLMLHIKMENGNFIKSNTSLCGCFKVYFKILFSRYMRFLPFLGFLILINSNILLHLQKGPFWNFMMASNQFACTKYWWKSILMINNFDISRSCLSHTWYLAADFQLYAFYLMILIFIKRYPRYKLCLFLIIALVSALIPVLINYLLKLKSIPFMNLESFRYFYLLDIETGSQLYLPSYTNLHGFLVGIICGEFYKKINKSPRFKDSIGKLLKYTPYIEGPCIVGIFALGTLALEKQSSIWTALYGLLQRHLTVIILTASSILPMMCKKSMISRILSTLPFRLLARLSFQVYLWHFNVMLVIANYHTQPIHMTYFLMFIVFLATYLSANILALIFAVSIEYPIAELLTLINLK